MSNYCEIILFYPKKHLQFYSKFIFIFYFQCTRGNIKSPGLTTSSPICKQQPQNSKATMRSFTANERRQDWHQPWHNGNGLQEAGWAAVTPLMPLQCFQPSAHQPQAQSHGWGPGTGQRLGDAETRPPQLLSLSDAVVTVKGAGGCLLEAI